MNTYPLALPRGHIRQILEREARTLIVTRSVRLGEYELHDEAAVRRNKQHLAAGRPDLQREPAVMTVEIAKVQPCGLLDLDLLTVRRAGFKTLEDFYLDWLARRHRVRESIELKVCDFRITEDARYLHQKVHRGYTRNPRESVRGELAALSADEQEEHSRDARDRDVERAADPLRRQRDQIARALEEMQEHLHRVPNQNVARSIRRLNAELRVLNRKLA